MPETILLIEDEEDVSDLIRYHLKKSKYRVISAADGLEGLRLASEERPDAVILDVMLPRLNGFEVAKRMKADPSTASIPLLILSAKGESEHRIKGLELGADDYLAKPFSPKDHDAITANIPVFGEVKGQRVVYAYPEDQKKASEVRMKDPNAKGALVVKK